MTAGFSPRRASRLIGAAAACVVPAAWAAGPATHWVEAWYSAPVAAAPVWSCNQVRAFKDRTVRQVVRLEAGGSRVRVRLTNELGRSSVTVGAVRIALSSANGVTKPGSGRWLTFGGRRTVSLGPGRALVSDPVALHVRRFQDLAISVYYPGHAAPTGHLHQLLISRPGNHAAARVWPRSRREQAPAIASGVEVASGTARRVLVAFGDSITEGYCSTAGTHRDYPEQLARLLAARSRKRWVVINSGISGNQVLRDGAGPSGLSRFARDALDIPGVEAIVLLEGINDIGDQDGPRGHGTLSAHTLIAAYRRLIRQAHAKGLKIYLGTLTPYEGAGYWSPSGAKVRERVNAWIRRGRGFDGVIAFDAALRDPAHPRHFIGADECRGELHPNDAGYRLMARTVFRRLFAPGEPLASDAH